VGRFSFPNPLKSPLVQGGTLFSSHVAPQCGMNSPEKGEESVANQDRIATNESRGVEGVVGNVAGEVSWLNQALMLDFP